MQKNLFTGHNGGSTVWKHETYKGIIHMTLSAWKNRRIRQFVRRVWIAEAHSGEGIYYNKDATFKFEGTPIMGGRGYLLASQKTPVAQRVSFYLNDLAPGKSAQAARLLQNELRGYPVQIFHEELDANEFIDRCYVAMLKPVNRDVNTILVIDPNGPGAIDMDLVTRMVLDRRLKGRLHYVIHLSSNALNRIKGLYSSPHNQHTANIRWIDEAASLHHILGPFFDLRGGWISTPGLPNGNDFFLFASFDGWRPRSGWAKKNMAVVHNATDAYNLIENYRKSAT